MSKDFNVNEELAFIDQLDGYAFECYLADMFKAMKYKVSLTNPSGDFGADLLLRSPKKRRIVVQAKRYQAYSRVGLAAIQEVYAAKSYYKADLAWVITTSSFTEQAKQLANRLNVKLFERLHLAQFLHTTYGNGTFRRRKFRRQETLSVIGHTSGRKGCLGSLFTFMRLLGSLDTRSRRHSQNPYRKVRRTYNQVTRPYRKARRMGRTFNNLFK